MPAVRGSRRSRKSDLRVARTGCRRAAAGGAVRGPRAVKGAIYPPRADSPFWRPGGRILAIRGSPAPQVTRINSPRRRTALPTAYSLRDSPLAGDTIVHHVGCRGRCEWTECSCEQRAHLTDVATGGVDPGCLRCGGAADRENLTSWEREATFIGYDYELDNFRADSITTNWCFVTAIVTPTCASARCFTPIHPPGKS